MKHSLFEYFRNIFSLDVRSLALFRIAISLVIGADIITRFHDLQAHYTDIGVLPRLMVARGSIQPLFSLFFINGGSLLPAVLFFCTLVAALCLLVGYRTRLATAVLWLLMVSIHVRNPLILSQGDVILHLFLFWGMFLPLGAVYSLDQAMSDEEEISYQIFSGGSVAYIVQIAIMYWLSALNKSAPEWWPQGTAVWYALNMDHFATSFAYILLAFPLLTKILTFGVLIFEYFGPFLFFSPVFFSPIRALAVILFLGMHAGFRTFLELGTFVFICCSVLLALLPGWFWEQLDAWRVQLRGSRYSVRVYFDGECQFCRKMIAILRIFFALPKESFRPAQTVPEILREMEKRSSWIVSDAKGILHEKYDAFLQLLAASPIPIFWPFARLLSVKPLRKLGTQIYEKIAGNRGFWAHLLGWFSFRPQRRLVAADSMIAVGFLICVILHNIDAVSSRHFLPQSIRSVLRLTQLEQWWNMFAPYPAKADGWFIFAAPDAAGKQIDLLNGGRSVDFNKPLLLSERYPNERWRKYFFSIQSYTDSYLPFLMKYSCRESFSTKKISGDSARIQVYFLIERTLLDAPQQQPSITFLGTYTCDRNGTLEAYTK